MFDVSSSTILAVDDTATNIEVVKGVLSNEYRILAAINGDIALRIVKKQKPDLILLDVMMPEMDGYEVCRRLKQDEETRDIPVIFLTAKSQENDETKGLSLGAVDYITKPISPAILQERVKNHLLLKASHDYLTHQNQTLEDKIAERTKQLNELQDVTLVAMGALAESRDPETGNHIRRTQKYVKVLATELAKTPKYKDHLRPETITALYKSAPLHDIGKVGIADNILLKPGKLTEEEFDAMKLHTYYGRTAIESAENSLNTADDFLIFAKEIAYSHHEKWDGSGYPDGLQGEDIPLSARIMAVADVYDALVSERCYKPAFSHEKSVNIIEEGRGSHFDPYILDNFHRVTDQFNEIAVEYCD